MEFASDTWLRDHLGNFAPFRVRQVERVVVSLPQQLASISLECSRVASKSWNRFHEQQLVLFSILVATCEGEYLSPINSDAWTIVKA